jgi:hypothetical protein
MKLLITILSCSQPPYTYIIENGIKKTWNSTHHPDIETYHYFGGSVNQSHDKDNIYLRCPEDYYSLGIRTLECFDYCLRNFEFDFLLRTNISSYIHKYNLMLWLANKPRENFYSGVVGEYGHGASSIKFASGAGIFMSRDIVEKIVKQADLIDTSLIDDVAIGKLLSDTKITPAVRIDLHCEHQNLNFDLSSFHFRCKCEQDRTTDSLVMQAIHNKFYPDGK